MASSREGLVEHSLRFFLPSNLLPLVEPRSQRARSSPAAYRDQPPGVWWWVQSGSGEISRKSPTTPLEHTRMNFPHCAWAQEMPRCFSFLIEVKLAQDTIIIINHKWISVTEKHPCMTLGFKLSWLLCDCGKSCKGPFCSIHLCFCQFVPLFLAHSFSCSYGKWIPLSCMYTDCGGLLTKCPAFLWPRGGQPNHQANHTQFCESLNWTWVLDT